MTQAKCKTKKKIVKTDAVNNVSGDTSIKNRVLRLVNAKAGDLVSNPDNWRLHPESQRQALKNVLSEVGIADAFLAYETSAYNDKGKKELVLIDGHLRKEEIPPDSIVPVLVLDVDDDEAKTILTTHDAIGHMAQVNEDKLTELLNSLTDSETLKNLSESVKDTYQLWDLEELPTKLSSSNVTGDIGNVRMVLAVNFADQEEMDAFLTELGFVGKELKMRKVTGDYFMSKIKSSFDKSDEIEETETDDGDNEE